MVVVLSWIFVLLPFVVAAALGVLLPTLVVLLYHRFGAGLVVVAASFVIDALTMGNTAIQLGINLYFADLLLLIVGISAFLRLMLADDFPLRQRAWVIFSLLVFASLGVGLVTFGSAAGVQARPYFYFVVSGLYAMSFPVDDRQVRQTTGALVSIAVVITCLTIYRWIVFYTPIPSLLPDEGTYNIDGAIRVVKSMEALVIIQAFVIGVFFAASSRSARVAQALAPVLLGVTLVLQHRSVWLAGLAGVMIRFILVRSRASSKLSQIALLIGVVLVTAAPVFLSSQLSGISEQVAHSTERVLQGADTTGERLSNWKATIQMWYGGGPKSILIGQGFGGEAARFVDDPSTGGYRRITYFAHNLYVQTLFNTGLVGLLAYLACVTYVFRGLQRINSERDGVSGDSARLLLVLLAMQLAYYVPYGTDYLQSFVFGVALAYVARLQRQRVATDSRSSVVVRA